MIYQASKLYDQFSLLKEAVRKSSVLRQSDCIIFRSGRAYSFSGHTFAIIDSPFEIEGAVNYETLLHTLKLYAQKELDVDVTFFADHLIIRNGRSKVKIPVDPNIVLFADAVDTPSLNWVDLEDERLIRQCCSVVDANRNDISSMLHIKGAFAIGDECKSPDDPNEPDDLVYVEGASARQIMRANVSLSCGEFLVPAKLTAKVLSLLNGSIQYQETEKWFWLQNDVARYAIALSRLGFIANIKNYLKIVASDNKEITFPEEISDEFFVIDGLTDKSKKIRFSLTENGCGRLQIHDSTKRYTFKFGNCVIDSPITDDFYIDCDLLKTLVGFNAPLYISKSGIRISNDLVKYVAAIDVIGNMNV